MISLCSWSPTVLKEPNIPKVPTIEEQIEPFESMPKSVADKLGFTAKVKEQLRKADQMVTDLLKSED
jgi:hypothetical protein